MDQELYSIIFSSATGNTKLLAETLHGALPLEQCAYFGPWNREIPETPVVYVGFWTDKGNADPDTLALLKELRNKKVFLFGTAGFGGSAEYFANILSAVQAELDPSNTVVGTYMCQGRMPQSVRQRYVAMKQQPNPASNLDMLIENFDRALAHPDAGDLERLKQAVQ